MDLAAFSPRKLQLINQCSPRASARKRSLFPSNSPQSNDLGLISELFSDDSDVYSPPLMSPASSDSIGKPTPSPINRMDKILKVANHLTFGLDSSKRKSPRKSLVFGKENCDKKSPQVLEKDNFDDHFVTILSKSLKVPSGIPVEFDMKSSGNFITPKKGTSVMNNRSPRRSPRSASKQELTIKPNSFYGNAAPILATNQTNRIQGMKCVFRPLQQPRAKTKLLFEEKPQKKRGRSRSMDAMREAKKRKTVYTGVYHAIPKPVKHNSPPFVYGKQETIREKTRKITDLSRTPYGMKKKQEGWEHTLRFTKPMRYDESSYLGTKRKFFKSSVRDSPTLSLGSPGTLVSPNVQKKRKLLDTSKNYLDENAPDVPEINGADISELIRDHDSDKLQDKPEVDDILLRLEEEDEEEKKKESEIQMLMNILEDSPTKVEAIDCLSNCTASLDLNDSPSESGCSRFSLDEPVTQRDLLNEKQSTPRRMFTVFNASAPNNLISETTQQGSSSKKKWHGVGHGQLQIDAGQKRFGACQCPECGMLYQSGEAEDEMQHHAFHNNLSALRHTGWKNENVVGRFGLDYALVVTGNDLKTWQQKALEVITIVDKSLGITSEVSNVMHNHKVFLYISGKRIVGCMVASPVNRAYKLIGSESDVDICSEESYPVRCGISRMWTLFSHRKRGVATSLLDTVRRNFMYGSILSKEDIAFSIPTPDGKKFAIKYMGYPNFNVYTGY